MKVCKGCDGMDTDFFNLYSKPYISLAFVSVGLSVRHSHWWQTHRYGRHSELCAFHPGASVGTSCRERIKQNIIGNPAQVAFPIKAVPQRLCQEVSQMCPPHPPSVLGRCQYLHRLHTHIAQITAERKNSIQAWRLCTVRDELLLWLLFLHFKKRINTNELF